MMEPLTLTIANDLFALSVLQAATVAFIRAAGCEQIGIAREMELVVEEIITNIIKFEYSPGQKEQIEVRLKMTERQTLDLTIRFKGIPFDVEYLQLL